MHYFLNKQQTKYVRIRRRKMEKICVIGAGSWGTALAVTLVDNGHDVVLYMRRKEQYEETLSTGKNLRYFPDKVLPEALKYSNSLDEALEGAGVVVLAVSSQGNRETIENIKTLVSKDAVIVNVSKGLEKGTGFPCSQISKEILPNHPFAVLSGPSHAEEVMLRMPTALVCASEKLEIAEKIQDIFSNHYMRVYVNEDVVGVELGGALKNIIAFGIGVVDGLGFGDNTKAAIMTRGIAEITRFGVNMGAKVETFRGLAGVGDLIVTCTSMHSRNRRAGILVGKGYRLEEVQKEINMVVEGIIATKVIGEMAKQRGVELPITQEIYSVLFEGSEVRDSVKALMGREKKHEVERF